MKIAFAQTNPRVGDISSNLEKIKQRVKEAVAAKARLIVFPELAITGYPLRDLLDYRSIVDANLKALESLAPLSKEIAIVIGCIHFNTSKIGKPYFNCASLMDGGKVVGKYKKRLLPYYDVFEEERYFEPGNEPGIFDLDGKKIGITICEDIWNSANYVPRPYAIDPFESYDGIKLDLVVNLSASPFILGKPENRLSLAKEITQRIGASFILCNQVGANDELIFDGSSFALQKSGVVASSLPAFEEGLSYFDLAANTSSNPEFSANSNTWLEKALTLGIRDYVHKSGGRKVCLGLSGGIDSALVAQLAVRAVGSDNVLTFSMPSRFSSVESQADALLIAENLGIDCKVVSIDTFYQQYADGLQKTFGHPLKSLTLENIQPRIRMSLLMALSNESGALLLNTSNKSELSTGFATLYGDSAGALSVIGDLKKHEVYSLAQHLNQGNNALPASIFERKPSAELKENQIDQDVLPPYDELDALVIETVEHRKSFQGVSEKFRKLHTSTEYKRRQFPPILKVTEKAFGMGRRMPLAASLQFL